MFSYEALQWTTAIAHYVVAISLLIYSGASETFVTSEINLYYSQWVPICEGSNSCDDGCYNELKSLPSAKLQMSIAVAFTSILSGTNHLIQALSVCTKNKYFVGEILKGNLWLRSLDYSITASLMVVVLNAMFTTPTDIMVNLYSVATIFTVVWAGWASETLSLNNLFFPAKVVFWMASLGFLLGFGSSFVVFFVGIENTSSEAVTPPGIVWFYILWIFVSFMQFPLIQLFHIGLFKHPVHSAKRHLKYEVWYSLASLFSKLPLLGIFFIATLAKETLTGHSRDSECSSVNMETPAFIVVGSLLFICITIAIVFVIKMWPLIKRNVYQCKDIEFKSITKDGQPVFTKVGSKNKNSIRSKNSDQTQLLLTPFSS